MWEKILIALALRLLERIFEWIEKEADEKKTKDEEDAYSNRLKKGRFGSTPHTWSPDLGDRGPVGVERPLSRGETAASSDVRYGQAPDRGAYFSGPDAEEMRARRAADSISPYAGSASDSGSR